MVKTRGRRRRSRSPGFPSGLWWVLCALAVVVFATGYWVGARRGAAPRSAAPASGERPERQARAAAPRPASPPGEAVGDLHPESKPVATEDAFPPPPPAAGARVSLVIDDLGRSLEDLRQIERLGVDLSYSVLPFESHTREVVGELRRNGKEILCHLPMEPRNTANPGPGALTSSMSPEQLSLHTREALEAVPGAIGVNNHMGSSLTEDRRRMLPILEELKEQRLFFLDSRTSAASVGHRLAREIGLPSAERQVFLDRDPSPQAIREQFDRLLTLARERGAAIAIGHPYPSTLAVLAEAVPVSLSRGYEFVPVSFLLESSGSPE